MWARYVTLPSQDRIWTLTLTNKSAPKPKPKQQGVIFLLEHYIASVIHRCPQLLPTFLFLFVIQEVVGEISPGSLYAFEWLYYYSIVR